MDSNPIKKVKVENMSDPRSSSSVDELYSGKKLINKLNHDCLAKVLMHVPVLERPEMEEVCQKWNEACEFSWHGVKKLDWANDFFVTLDKKEKIMKMIMMKCGRFLTHLKMGDAHLGYSWKFDVLKNNCKNIIHFDIDMMIQDNYGIPEDNFVGIIQSMKKLKCLKVAMSPVWASDICSKISDKLPDDMKEIHFIAADVKLTLYSTQSLKVSPVLDKFNNLHCLTLRAYNLTKTTLESILQSKNTLSELDLSFCIFPFSESSIFSNLGNLEQLRLLAVKNFNVNEIISISHNCSKLKHFEFANANNDGSPRSIPYRIFCELKYLNLEHLNISWIDESSDNENRISKITENWKELKRINVNCGNSFSQLDIQEITKFEKLQNLDIRYAKTDSQSLINIANNCLELKELSIYFRNFPETALEKLTNLKKLEKLDFTECKNLTGNVLFKIANNCRNLIDLDLRGCNNVTMSSLIQVGKLQNLKRLVLNNIVNVPNAMFFSFRNLEHLSCHKCRSVADEGIMKVIDNCVKLSYLDVKDTRISFKSLICASKRKLVFKVLKISADLTVENHYKQIISTHHRLYLT